MSNAQVTVVLRRLSGEALGEVNVERRTSWRAVKHTVASRWPIPLEAQTLVLNQEVLDDCSFVWTVVDDNEELLEITLVVSLEKLFRRLEEPNAKTRQRAVTALATAAQRGDPEAIAAISACLADPSAIVKAAAVKALSKVAGRGCHIALSHVLGLLENEDIYVRRTALEALSHVALRGDQRVLLAVRSFLDHDSTPVSSAAADAEEVLREMAQPTPSSQDDDGPSGSIEAVSMETSTLDERGCKRCPSGHFMKRVKVAEQSELDDGDSGDEFVCDGCDGVILKGEFFDCRLCDFDLCLYCARTFRV